MSYIPFIFIGDAVVIGEPLLTTSLTTAVALFHIQIGGCNFVLLSAKQLLLLQISETWGTRVMRAQETVCDLVEEYVGSHHTSNERDEYSNI